MLVLAAAADALRLAALPPQWLKRQRGQVSWAGDGAMRWRPQMPVASGGYVLPMADGRLLFGASSRDDDDDPTVRVGDHADNLARVARWLGDASLPDPAMLAGRVGWRAVTPDRLPLVGPVPAFDAPRPARADAPRLLPRQPGLWLHSGLGSRGLTTAALCGELLAAWASGTAWPVESDLVDAVDPARWLVRYGVAPM
jgi:tRNA 5-methylaminomethyl-2-thiouridine biosynthesis bifunctional protein